MAVASGVGPLTQGLLNDYVPGLSTAANLLPEAPLGALNTLLQVHGLSPQLAYVILDLPLKELVDLLN